MPRPEYVVRLRRHGSTPMGTIGELWLPNMPPVWTLEDQWLDNRPFKSCIPNGRYELRWSAEKGRYYVENVPGRFAIQIHAGNTEDDTTGCILPGLSIGVTSGKMAVLNSRAALAQIAKELSTKQLNPIYLDVSWIDHNWR